MRYTGRIPDDQGHWKNNLTLVSFDWKWWFWDEAVDADRIARNCPKGWMSEHPGEPCEETERKYRMKCTAPSKAETGGGRWDGVKCFGERRSLTLFRLLACSLGLNEQVMSTSRFNRRELYRTDVSIS